MLIEPSVAAVHALIASFSPMISLMSQSLLVLPSVNLVIVSICVFSIKCTLRVSFEVLPDLGVSLSLRACFIFGGVNMSGVGGDD